MTGIINSAYLGLYGNGGVGSGSPLVGRFGQSDAYYVNTTTGNLILRSQDEVLVSLGLDLALVRTYNSQGLVDGDNNDGWRLGLYRRLHSLTGTLNSAGSTITKVFGDGAEVVFTYDTERGLYVSTEGEGAHDTLAFNSASSEWTYSDGSSLASEVYDASGRLLRVVDADGNATVFTYSGSLISEITDAAGQTTYLDYVGNNLSQIRVVVSGITQTLTRYTYDTANRLTDVRVDLSPSDNSIADGATYLTSYTYEGTSTRIASITHGDTTTVAFTYEEAGGQYRIKTVTDGEGKVTTFTYLDATHTEISDPLGFVTTYVRDATGRLTQVLSPAVDGIRFTTTYSYDAAGNLTSITDARNQTTVMEYDARGNLTLTRDAAGNTVIRTYSSTTQLLTETAYLTPDPDGAGAGQPSAPVTTRYVYDSEGHLRFTVSAEGRVTEQRYAGNGHRTATITYAGGTYDLSALAATDALSETQLTTWVSTQNLAKTERSDYDYDFRGQVITATTYAIVNTSGAGVEDGTHSVTRFVYDQRGRLLQTIDARGEATADPNDYVTTYTYDGLGRLLSATQWVASGVTRTTLTTYDDAQNKTLTTLANGLATTSTFDRTGRLVSVSQANGAEALGTTTYQYDANGLQRVTTDATGAKTYSLYDEAGRQVAAIDSLGALAETVYDATGNVVQVIRYATRLSASALTSLTDIANPAVTLNAVRPAADSANDRNTRRIYDSANRLAIVIETTDTDAAQGYVTRSFYDGAGRLTDVIRYAAAIAIPATPTLSTITALVTANSNDRHTRLFYSADGRQIGSLDAQGYLSEQRYDAAGRLIETVRSATAAAADLRATGTFAQLKTSVGTNAGDQHRYTFYNGKGQIVANLDAENYLTEYVYDLAGNPTQSVRYYNQAVVYTGTQTPAELRPAAHANDRVILTAYNGANQVTSVTTNPQGTVTRYTYDNVGNLIQTDKAWNTAEVRTTQARYDVQGRVIRELTGEGSLALQALLAANPSATQAEIDAVWTQYSLRHGYDAAGRRTSSTDQNGNKTLYYYDAGGHPTLVVNAQGEVTEAKFNAFGEAKETIRYGVRVDTTGLTGGAVTSALSAQLAAIASAANSRSSVNHTLRGAVKNATDALGNVTQYTYNAFGDLASAIEPISTGVSLTRSFSYDHRGLLIQTTEDASGINRLTSRVYDAFGRVVQTTDGTGVSRSFVYDRLGREVSSADPSGTRFQTYDAFSRTLTQVDARGNTTTSSYNDAARTFTVTTSEGVTVITASNRHGETVSVTDGNGEVTTYTYDKNGNLKTTTDPLDNVKSNQYDRANRLIESVDANGIHTIYTYSATNRLLTKTIDPSGLALTMSYSYDARGQVFTVTDPNGTVSQTTYNAKGEVVSISVDPSGLNLITTYTYDAQGRTLTVTEGVGTAAARTTSYVYDKLGRRIETHVDPTGLNLTATFTYDNNDNLVAKVDGAGSTEARVTRYAYDANNRLIYAVDALGGVTQSDYDANGNVIATTRYANAIDLIGFGNVVSVATIQSRIVPDSARDVVTRNVYDRDNRLVFTVDGFWGVTKNVYDGNGNVIDRIQYAAAIASGTPLTIAGITAALAPNASLDHSTRTIFDAGNRAVYSIDALGFVTQQVYDANGNAIRAIAYANAVNLAGEPTASAVATAIVTNVALDRSTRNVYDATNRLVYTIDALGYVKEHRYDGAGNLVEGFCYANAVTLAQTAPTLQQVQAALNPDSARDQRTQYAYDRVGRLTQTTDAEGHSESYAYDALGNKIGFTNKNGDTWTYEYDKAGRLTTETTPLVAVTRLTQNADGSVTPVTTQEAIVTRLTYDALGNVKTRTEAFGRPEARTTSYVYDALGRQIQTVFPAVGVYNATADQAANYIGRNDSVATPTSTTYYDTLGRAYASKDVRGAFSYKVYDVLGRVKYDIDAERYVSEYTHDAFGNQLTLTRYATALAEANYTAAEAAASATTLPAVTLANVQAWLTANVAQDRTITNTYDRLDRVTETKQPATYTFDSTTNQYFTAAATTRNTYNAFGQVIKQSTLRNLGADNTVNTADDQWIDTYLYYDTRGQKTAEVNALGYLTRFQYDANGNVIETTEYAQALNSGWSTSGYGTPTVTTATDANSVSSIGFDRTTRVTYDRLNRKAEETKVGVIYATATYGGTVTATNQLGNLATRYTYDALGNLASVTDPTGATTYTYYDVLGRVTATAEPGRLSEGVGGAALPPLSVKGTMLNWDKSTIAGTIATLRYRAVGSGTWIEASTGNGSIVTNASRYEVNLSSQPNDVYEFNLSYTRAGQSTPFAQGSGKFNLTGSSVSTGSINAASFIQSPFNYSTSSATYTTVDWWTGTDESGNKYKGYDESGNPIVGFYDYGWAGSNNVNLSWSSLLAWGNGDVKVTIDYVGRNPSGSTYNSTRTQTFTSASSPTGSTLSWSGEGLNSVSRVQVWKMVDGEWASVYDSPGNVTAPERLILKGNIAGLTEINIAGIGVRTAAAMGGGVVALDLGTLARGTYTYTAVGSASAEGGSFTVYRSSVSGRPVVQETAPVIGAAAPVWKLYIANLPSNAASVVLEYRKAGTTDPYLTAATPTTISPGLFTVSYDDLPNGAYETRLTLRDASGNAIDLTSVGGNALGEITGSMSIVRGGQTLPEIAISGTSMLTPLTTMQHNIFGNVVTQTRHANGATNANGASFIAGARDQTNDQHDHSFYDSHGHAVQTVDSEGVSKYTAYNAAGGIAKQWHSLTDADGQIQKIAKLYSYDRLGQQVGTSDVVAQSPDLLPNSFLVSTFSINHSISSANYTTVDWWTGYDESNNKYKAYDESNNPIIGFYDYGWTGSNNVNLSWPSLAAWGSGEVKVTVDYVGRNSSGGTYNSSRTQTFGNSSSLTGSTLSWSGEGLNGVTRIQVWKGVDGQWVQLADSSGNMSANRVLAWKTSPIAGLAVTLLYRLAGSSNAWTELSISNGGIVISGSRYLANITGLTNSANYEYQISYTQPGDTAAYVSGSGVFQNTAWWQGAVAASTPVGSPVSISPLVSSYSLTVNGTSSATYTTVDWWTGYDESNNKYKAYDESNNPIIGFYDYGWAGSNSVNLSWPSLSAWGSGDVKVTLDYVGRNPSGGTYSASRTHTFGGASSLTGATLSWGGEGFNGVSRVQVWKSVDGQWVQLADTPGNMAANRLLAWQVSSLPGATSILRYRAAGSGAAWSELTMASGAITISGSRYLANIAGLANGQTYEYQISISRPGQSTYYAAAQGAFQNTAGWQAPVANSATIVDIDRLDARYSSFGEITAKGRNGEWQEYVEYDKAGRLWQTNQGDGVDKVYLYNLQGQATADIRSATLDLRSYTGPAQVSALTNVRRSETDYDLLGRTIQQTQASFNLTTSPEPITATVQVSTFSLSRSTSSASYGAIDWWTGYDESNNKYKAYDESNNPIIGFYDYGWSGSNNVSLTWPDLSAWSSGDVKVTIEYVGRNPSGGTYNSTRTQTFGAAASVTGATLSWSGEGLNSVTRIQIWKMVDGQWVQLADTPGNMAATRLLSWQAPPVPGVTAILRYRAAGSSSAWNEATTANGGLTLSGSRYLFDATALTNAAAYDYEITYTRLGESIPYAAASGTFTNTVGWTGAVQAPNPIVTTYTPTINQTLDRWNNVLAVNDPRNAAWITNYRYDYSNHAIEERKPETNIWTVSGANLRTDGNSTNDRPTTRSYYDARGLAIATVDSNGNVNGQRYDEAGQLISEHHADGGVVKLTYDALGRKVASTDANGNVTTYTYNRNDLMVKEQLPLGSTTYAYNEAGDRISATNALNETTRYFYDSRGNVVMTRLPMGGTNINTRYFTTGSYDASGRKIADGNGNGDSQTWTYDYFGRLQSSRDLGGGVTTYTYDDAGQFLTQTRTGGVNPGQNLTYQYYDNGQMKRITDNMLQTETFYEYDMAGHRTRERFKNLATSEVYQDVRTSHDELGRVTGLNDNRYNMQYYYDAAGNRRRTLATYFDNQNQQQTKDYWYTYDAMNRITVSQGVLQGGVIQKITAQGIDLAYDAGGNRRTANFYENGSLIQEAYSYDAHNRLTNTNRAGLLTSARSYDLASRVTEYVSYLSPGTIKDRQVSTYNTNGWLKTAVSYNASNSIVQTISYDYVDAYDAVGNVLKYTVNIPGSYTNTYTKEYAKFGSYKEKVVHGTSTYFSPGDTSETYDVNGNLIKVVDQFNANKTRDFIVNTQGMILQKKENGQTQYYYYADGNPVGSTGDIGGANADFDYNYTPVSSAYPGTTPGNYTVSQGDTLKGIALAVYGDTKLWYLIADANGLRTDSDLKVGQTLTIPNKISNLHNDYTTHKVYAPGEIIGDTTPTLPEPPPPPPPPNKKGGCGGFAMILMIVVAVVVTIFTAGAALAAIAPAMTAGMTTMGAGMAALAGGASLGFAGVAAAAIGAAVGSIASQLVGMAVGAVDKFSWKSVAVSALSAGVTSGMGAAFGTGGIAGSMNLSGWQGAMVNAAAGSAINQGISIITGQQKKFDWKGVAFAAVSAGAQSYLKTEFKGTAVGDFFDSGDPQRARAFSWGDVARQTGTGIVKGAVVQAFSNHGKVDWQKVGADAFGNALANSIVGAMRFGEEQEKLSTLSTTQRSLYDSARKLGASYTDALKLATSLSSRAGDNDGFVPPDPLGSGRDKQLRYAPLAADGITPIVERPAFKATPYEGESLTRHQGAYNDLLSYRDDIDLTRRHLLSDEQLARSIYDDAIAGNQNVFLTQSRLNARDVANLSFSQFGALINERLYQTTINIDDLAVRTAGLIDRYGDSLVDQLPAHPFSQAVLDPVGIDKLGKTTFLGAAASLLPGVGFLQSMALGRDQWYLRAYADIGLISPDQYEAINKEAGTAKWLTFGATLLGPLLGAGAKFAKPIAGSAAASLSKLGSIELAQGLAKFSGIPRYIGEVGEVIAQRTMQLRGEILIQSKWGGNKGFDALSVFGEGAGAQLFINEVKNVSGSVAASKFTALGVGGKTPAATLAENIAVAQERIMASNLSEATKQTVLSQLRDGGAVVRIIGNSRTTVSSATMTRVQQATGNRYATQLGY